MRRSSGRPVTFATGLGGPPRPSPANPRGASRPAEVMDAEHRRLVMRGLEAVRDGDFAAEDEVEATLARARR